MFLVRLALLCTQDVHTHEQAPPWLSAEEALLCAVFPAPV